MRATAPLLAPVTRAQPPASRAVRTAAASPQRSTGKGRFHACSFCIMEDDTECMTLPGAHVAHAVAKVDAVHAAPAGHRTMMHGEDHRVAAAQRHHLRPRLHPRPLLGQDELATGEIFAWL